MGRPLTVALAPGVWRIRLVGDYVNGFAFRDDDARRRLTAHRERGDDPLGGEGRGHPHVDDHEVGPVLAELGEGSLLQRLGDLIGGDHARRHQGHGNRCD